jgi:alkylation response protein AidB-like acyl-CoA dehydrogenase
MEAAGRLDTGLARDLARAGAFRMAVPVELGGLELPVLEQLDVLEELARHDGATGWCAMIGATTGVLAAWLPRSGAERIWSGPEVVTGGAYAPTGRAVVADDGYRVSGRWEWGSGSSHCDWLLGGALVHAPSGDPVLDDHGRPVARLCFAPTDRVRIVPNWDVLGMRATGSDDLEMVDVEVPAELTVSLTADRPWATGPLYRFPPFGLLALGIAAVSLGVGRAAADAVVELAAAKRPGGGRRALGDRSTVRDELARCEAELRAVRALLRDAVAGVWSAAEDGDEVGTAGRADLRLAATHTVTTVADVVARLHRLAGGTGVRHGQRIERCFRDAHVATGHVLVGAHLYATVGGVLLGAEPGFAEL